jgi:Raf kinase inhibitor-like YbhB/YbcL family protein
MGNLKLTSLDFEDGGEIPRECGYKNGNKAPILQWELDSGGGNELGGDDSPASFALIMDDPDAMGAVGKVWVHWVVWNIEPDVWEYGPGDAAEGITDFGEVGYGGPAPPDKRHTYVFKLYALNIKLDLPSESTKADVEKAMRGYIIEQTTLTGTYAP